MFIEKLSLDNLNEAAILFDQYRLFYKRETNLHGAIEFLTHRLNHGQSKVFLCRDKEINKAVGFMQLYPTFSSLSLCPQWILNDLYVVEAHRKKGVAKLLLIRAEALAKETQANSLNLMTAKINIPAQKLYEAEGWVKDEALFTYSKKI